jgi:hypothetical protein
MNHMHLIAYIGYCYRYLHSSNHLVGAFKLKDDAM